MHSTSRETGFCSAFDGAGVEYKVDADGYVSLTATDDFYFVVAGGYGADLVSVQITTGSAVAGTFTVETCLWPRDKIQGPATKTDWNETSGIWVKNDPSTAYVPTVGTGWSVSNLTLTKTAGVGGAVLDIGNLGARRMRLKFNCTTSGTVSVLVNAKS